MWRATAGSFSPEGSSCAPAAADTGPGEGSVDAWPDGPLCTSLLLPGLTFFAAVAWTALFAASFS